MLRALLLASLLASSAASAMSDTALAAKFMAKIQNADTPMQVSEVTALTSVKARGETIVYNYEVQSEGQDSAGFTDYFNQAKPDFVAWICGEGDKRRMIKDGVTVEENHFLDTGELFGQLQVTEQDCLNVGS